MPTLLQFDFPMKGPWGDDLAEAFRDLAAIIERSQHAGYRKTFLWYGMTNPTFVAYCGRMSKTSAAKVAERAQQLVG